MAINMAFIFVNIYSETFSKWNDYLNEMDMLNNSIFIHFGICCIWLIIWLLLRINSLYDVNNNLNFFTLNF